jgi:hypothetical protein
MVSPDAASRPRNDHRPTMVALLEAGELDADIGDDRSSTRTSQELQMQVVGPARSSGSAGLSRSRRTRWTGPDLLPARSGRRGKEQR